MGLLDQIDIDSLVCTFCGNKPVVAYTFAVDAEIDENGSVNPEFVQDSIVAVCKEHVAILQERFEKEIEGAEIISELDGDGDG